MPAPVFPNPTAPERFAWDEQYFINQWDALEAIFDAIVFYAPSSGGATEATLAAFKTANHTDLLAVIADLESGGFNVAAWAAAMNNNFTLSNSAGNNVEVLSATGATPTAAMDALEVAIDAFKAGATYIKISGPAITVNDALFTDFTASCIVIGW